MVSGLLGGLVGGGGGRRVLSTLRQ